MEISKSRSKVPNTNSAFSCREQATTSQNWQEKHHKLWFTRKLGRTFYLHQKGKISPS